ncbi:hypothetical protein PBY51_005597 [Eleginops maclovinus]|uniref:Uncharacterized protein n=1 Tax=Eleginops maclovinus TaxID=56733 RepID=A0AAN7X8N0_ELEMC|nr:hypothetical protein PBY51_005597 [Eleginops maclovinus]
MPRRNESDRLLPGGFTATETTKRALRTPAAITIYFIRETGCRRVIYRPPAVRDCAGKTSALPHSGSSLLWELEEELHINSSSSHEPR